MEYGNGTARLTAYLMSYGMPAPKYFIAEDFDSSFIISGEAGYRVMLCYVEFSKSIRNNIRDKTIRNKNE